MSVESANRGCSPVVWFEKILLGFERSDQGEAPPPKTLNPVDATGKPMRLIGYTSTFPSRPIYEPILTHSQLLED